MLYRILAALHNKRKCNLNYFEALKKINSCWNVNVVFYLYSTEHRICSPNYGLCTTAFRWLYTVKKRKALQAHTPYNPSVSQQAYLGDGRHHFSIPAPKLLFFCSFLEWFTFGWALWDHTYTLPGRRCVVIWGSGSSVGVSEDPFAHRGDWSPDWGCL